jgi:RNA-dependent RNA polymerase
VSFVTTLEFPPVYHQKLPNVKETFSNTENIWRSGDTWMRQTDVVHFPQDLVRAPVSLRKGNALINIGKRVWFQLSNPYCLPPS